MWPVIAAIAIGGAMEAWGANQAGKAKSRSILDAGNAQAKAYETAAAETLQAGESEVFKVRLKGADVLGEARVAQGASGLEGGEDALRKTAYMTALDTAMIKSNARRAAWGLTTSAAETRRQAQASAAAARAEGRNAALRSIIGTGASLAMAGAKYGGGGSKSSMAIASPDAPVDRDFGAWESWGR